MIFGRLGHLAINFRPRAAAHLDAIVDVGGDDINLINERHDVFHAGF